jgi:hypothetical protein
LDRYDWLSLRRYPGSVYAGTDTLGGFDQAYGGSLLKLGLWQRTESTGLMDEPTPTGARLAAAYGRSIAKTTYARKLQGESSLCNSDLLDYSRAGGLNHLQPDGDEARALVDLFFNRPPFETEDGVARRDALLLGLFVAHRVAKMGVPAESPNADDLWVEQFSFFHAMRDADGKSHLCHVPAKLAKASDAHALLQLHRYFAFGLEHLLASVLDAADGAGGVTKERLSANLVWAEVAQAFSQTAAWQTPSTVAEWIQCLCNEIGPEASTEVVTLPMDRPSNEYFIFWALNEAEGAQRVGLALRLLLLLYHRAKRFQELRPELWAEASRVAGDGLWMSDFCDHADRGLSQHVAIQDYLADLLTRFVVLQHERVRQIKGSLARGWIERDRNGIVRKIQDYLPRYRGTRLRSAESILRDLGLLEYDDNGPKLTPSGESLLRREFGQL